MTLHDVYEEALELTARFGARPDLPLEAEQFLQQFITSFHGSREELLAELGGRVGKWFRSLRELPRWLQEPEWQFTEGRPMIFVGQVDIPRGSGLFHDDAAFYVFFDAATGLAKSVVQVA